jgi:hypothetical protein
MQLTTRNLARLRELYKNLAISQRELDQAASIAGTLPGK